MSQFFVYGRDTRRARAARHVEQQGACAICGTTGLLLVDHEHSEMGLVRGLLCTSCNTGLGLLGDNLEGISAALAYLTRHVATNTAYSETEDWQERRVKVKQQPVAPRSAPFTRTLMVAEGRDQEIRRLIDEGEPTRAIADRFGMSKSQVNRIYEAAA